MSFNGSDSHSEVAVAAVSRLPADLTIMKLENDNIMSLAAARPRDHRKIREDLIAQIDAYPSFARSAIYCKPVGKGDDGKQRFARGLSVRAAEALAEAYGYNRVRVDVTPVDEDHVKVDATFTDYQRGRIWQDGGIVSKFYRARSGQMVRHPDDRFYNVVVKSEASKRVREVILRSVPPGLRSELEEAIERQIDQLLDDSTIQKIVAKFSTKAVTLEMLEAHLGRTVQAGWTKEDRSNLLGMWNSIEDGETTVHELFGAQQGTNGAPKPPVAGASGKDLQQPREVKPEPKPESPRKPAKSLIPPDTEVEIVPEPELAAETQEQPPEPAEPDWTADWLTQIAESNGNYGISKLWDGVRELVIKSTTETRSGASRVFAAWFRRRLAYCDSPTALQAAFGYVHAVKDHLDHEAMEECRSEYNAAYGESAKKPAKAAGKK